MALTFNDEQEAALLKLLGLPEAAPGDTDAGLTLDTITDLAHQVEGMDATKPSTVAAAAKRHGMEVIDTTTLTALRTDAQEGRRVAAAARKADIEAKVEAAVNRGALTPGRRKAWVDLITADPALADVLAKVPDEAVVPLSEVGHATDTTDLAQPAGWFY